MGKIVVVNQTYHIMITTGQAMGILCIIVICCIGLFMAIQNMSPKTTQEFIETHAPMTFRYWHDNSTRVNEQSTFILYDNVIFHGDNAISGVWDTTIQGFIPHNKSCIIYVEPDIIEIHWKDGNRWYYYK